MPLPIGFFHPGPGYGFRTIDPGATAADDAVVMPALVEHFRDTAALVLKKHGVRLADPVFITAQTDEGREYAWRTHRV